MNSRAVGVVLVVLAVAVLAHPLYLWPHYGEQPYGFSTSPVANGVAGDVVEYESLPSAAQSAFDESRADGGVMLYSPSDDTAIEALLRAEYVRKDGSAYRVTAATADANWFIVTPIRVALSLLGGLLAVVGLRRTGHATTTTTAASQVRYVVGAAVGIGSLVAFDAVLRAQQPGFSAFVGFAALVVVAAGIPVGRTLERRDRWSGVAVVGLLSFLGLAAVGTARFTGLDPSVSAVLLAIPAGIGVALGTRARGGTEDPTAAA